MDKIKQQSLVLKYCKLVLISTGIVFVLWFLAGPVLKSQKILKIILDEDRIVETISWICLLAATIIGIKRITRYNKSIEVDSDQKKLGKLYWFFPIFSFFCLLEEISFGRNFYKYYERKEILGKKIDAIHDFLEVGAKFFRDRVPGAIIFLIGVVVCLIFLLLIILYYKRIVLVIKNNLSIVFLLCAIGFAFLASLIDLLEGLNVMIVDDFNIWVFIEETAELNVSYSLLFAALSIPGKPEGTSPAEEPFHQIEA
jgi:hypothetical protein